MAEPKPVDVTPLNPCDPGHGVPKAYFYSWRDPEAAVAVVCPRCGAMAMAATPELAQALWNDAHPWRQLTEEEEAGRTAVGDMEQALEKIDRQYLCDDNVHIIQLLPDGSGISACAQCGKMFTEHARIDVAIGTRAGSTST